MGAQVEGREVEARPGAAGVRGVVEGGLGRHGDAVDQQRQGQRRGVGLGRQRHHVAREAREVEHAEPVLDARPRREQQLVVAVGIGPEAGRAGGEAPDGEIREVGGSRRLAQRGVVQREIVEIALGGPAARAQVYAGGEPARGTVSHPVAHSGEARRGRPASFMHASQQSRGSRRTKKARDFANSSSTFEGRSRRDLGSSAAPPGRGRGPLSVPRAAPAAAPRPRAGAAGRR